MTPSTFEPHIGTPLAITVDAGTTISVDLSSVTRHAPRSHGARTEPFSLVFTASAGGGALAQATYSLDHSELGAMSVFLVPIKPDPSGAQGYEAVFN